MQSASRNPDEIWELLKFIPAVDRNIWLQVGMALHDEYGEHGLETFDHWSQTAKNYDRGALVSTWKSFRGSGVTMGSLVHLAKEHGWRPQRASSQNQTETSKYAKELWLRSSFDDECVGGHPYAVRKSITWAAGAKRGNASGRIVGRNADCVVVPVRNVRTAELQAVQCINETGDKQTFGSLRDGALILGNTLRKREPWYVVEGWASAVSTVFHLGKQVAICAFGKSNLANIAHQVAEHYRPDEIVVLEEVDG